MVHSALHVVHGGDQGVLAHRVVATSPAAACRAVQPPCTPISRDAQNDVNRAIVQRNRTIDSEFRWDLAASHGDGRYIDCERTWNHAETGVGRVTTVAP